MQCRQCGYKNPYEARFCGECSAALFPCAFCGRANRPSASYCDHCGAALTTIEAGAGEREGSARLAYPPSLGAEQILSSRSAREGERKLITVLFVDIADSSRLAQQVDAETLHDVLDAVLGLIAKVVHRNNGTVSHFLGDGLMALFGAPVALEDHALRAIHAALEMQEVIAGRAEEFEREHNFKLRLRVGLDTGRVVVGLIGDRMHMDYTAMGNTAHLADRMQSIAEPGSIFATEATWQAADGNVEAERLGLMPLRGQDQPVVVYRLTGRKRRGHWMGRRGDRLTRFVGRRRELEILRQLLAEAIAGRGQAIAITGEAGVGKSRLVYELHQEIDASRVDWFEGGCVANGQGVPYWPILEILRSVFGIEDSDGVPAIRAKVANGSRELGLSGGRLPLIEFLFNVPSAEDALRGLDPRATRAYMGSHHRNPCRGRPAASAGPYRREPALERPELGGFSRVPCRAPRIDAGPAADNTPPGDPAALGRTADIHGNPSRSACRRRDEGNAHSSAG